MNTVSMRLLRQKWLWAALICVLFIGGFEVWWRIRNQAWNIEVAIKAIAFSPDGNLLATAETTQARLQEGMSVGGQAGAQTHDIRLRQLVNGKIVRTLVGNLDDVGVITFSPNGQFLASLAFDSAINIWDVATGKLVETLPFNGEWANSINFSPDGQLLAIADTQSLTLWETSNWRVRHTFSLAVGQIRFSPDGKLLASAAFSNGQVRLWRVSDGQMVKEMPVLDARLVAWSADSQQLAIDNYGMARPSLITASDVAGEPPLSGPLLTRRPSKCAKG